ncbi:ATP-dependent helicase [Capnocytophaga sputigena]|uniref:DNA 3'-5' helicase n=1 Tax=Capnocytophaga sputigena TaxID=1019 RepID=A0AAX2I876_CAPSP|nr:UvrD-helicase domain-containing protein [Capnocytophaga sputigena]ATA83247.1 ATP-dependent DNA helicase [Capnocytophaga sputigena]EEB66006.1 UvrD/REP helicase [Capnocytophaga sputigena ATCC 33612]SQA74210.1 ATP-dependent DNA helicase pcrA [Capnocytophaga sputigena]
MDTFEKELNRLNAPQRAAVLQKEGPIIVIAGAGSGKTRVLTYRIANLMRQGVDAFHILALTFTNKAANEMKKRIADIVGNSEAKNLWMGTFHSVFAKILRFEADKLGYPQNFTIYDTQDSQRLINGIIKEKELDKDVYKYKQIQQRISSLKNNLITVRAYFNNPELVENDAIRKQPRFGEIYQEYVERCFKAGAMDFDDLLLKTNELLNVYPEVLAKYQNRFQYILVDEYQDTNHSQYLIVKALADRFHNICVVGDDAQSIYAFRGANINNILNFKSDYPEAKEYKLEQNYRSTKNIVEAANSVIEHNKVRLDKVVFTENEMGELIKVHRSPTDADEGRFVASSIFENKMQHQLANGKFAVLYRTNSQSRAIEDALRKRDIPYRIYGGLSFYQRKEIKDMLAYLRLIINPNDEEALVRIINFPARGIGETTMEKLTLAANHYKKSIFEIMYNVNKLPELHINSTTKQKLTDFVVMIFNLQALNQRANVFEVAEQVAKKTGLLQEFKKDGTPEGIAKMENIEEMLNGMKDFVIGQEDVADSTGSLAEYLEDVSLATDSDKEIGDDDRVALMTIHLAKGLEFPYVYIVGMEEDLFPLAKSIQSRDELEEERRLFYVALTRAEKQAYLTYAERRYRFGNLSDTEPSRFIEEIDERYLHYLTHTLSNPNYRYKPLIDRDIFGEVDKSKLRLQKPISGTPPSKNAPTGDEQQRLRKLKPVNSIQNASPNRSIYNELEVGTTVYHERFGKGIIKALEGVGNDKKAQVNFESGGLKNILLRFAKLTIINE